MCRSGVRKSPAPRSRIGVARDFGRFRQLIVNRVVRVARRKSAVGRVTWEVFMAGNAARIFAFTSSLALSLFAAIAFAGRGKTVW